MIIPIIILPTIAGFIFSGFHFFLKKTKEKILVLCIGRTISGVVLLYLYLFFDNQNIEFNFTWFFFVMLSIIAHTVACIFLSSAYRYANISLSLPIAKGISIIGVSFLSVIFYNELPGYGEILGVIFIISGILFLNIQSFQDIAFSLKGVKYSVLTGIIISVHLTFDKYVIQTIPILWFCGITNLGVGISLWFTQCSRIYKPSWIYIKNNTIISSTVIINSLAYALLLYAIKSLSSLSTLVASQLPLVCVPVLGIIFLKEKTNIIQLISIMTIIFGIVIYIMDFNFVTKL